MVVRMFTRYKGIQFWKIALGGLMKHSVGRGYFLNIDNEIDEKLFYRSIIEYPLCFCGIIPLSPHSIPQR